MESLLQVDQRLEAEIKKNIRDIADFPKPGIMFRDITPIFYDQQLCTSMVDALVENIGEKPDAIAGIESRGFLFGILVANRLNVPFVLVRKAGKLPYKTIKHEYALEYGTSVLEMHEDAIHPGWKVVIHDDLLATGGTAEATARLIEQLGATVSGFSFVVGLDFLNGKNKLLKHTNNITCLAHY
jgi:adenine phosphoribosyltransferase